MRGLQPDDAECILVSADALRTISVLLMRLLSITSVIASLASLTISAITITVCSLQPIATVSEGTASYFEALEVR